jgi:CheY-like chemotaxis protein
MPTAERPNLTGISVLVADDNDDALVIAATALRLFGATVWTARTAREALGLLVQSVRPDALVTDLAMPNENGLWLVDQLRRLPREQGGSIPAVALTGHRDLYSMAQAAGGFDAFLMKPLDPFALAKTIATLVGR